MKINQLFFLTHISHALFVRKGRKGVKENFVEELADTCSRILNLCGTRSIYYIWIDIRKTHQGGKL